MPHPAEEDIPLFSCLKRLPQFATEGICVLTERGISVLAPEQTAEHLKLCRELYDQLRRIRAHQEFKCSAATADLPINFTVLLGHLAQYMKWAARNAKVVEIASRMPPLRVGGNSDIA